jgi:hypothetical protein
MDHDQDEPWPEAPSDETAPGDPSDPAPWLSPFHHRDDPDESDDNRRPRPPRRASDRVWGVMREDYLGGETAAEVCRRWGVSVGSLRARAAAEGRRRADVPQADPEPRPREPDPDPGLGPPAPEPGPADYPDLARRAPARFERSLSRGRAAEASTWLRLHARLRALDRAESLDSIDSIDPVFRRRRPPSLLPS